MTAKRGPASLVKCQTCSHLRFEHHRRVNGRDQKGCAFKGCYCPSFVPDRSTVRPRKKTGTVEWEYQRLVELPDDGPL